MSDKKDFVRKRKDLNRIKKHQPIDATSMVREAIDDLWIAAQQAGYTSIRDYCKDYFENWEQIKAGVLDEIHEDYLHAVQNHFPKDPWASGVWTRMSTFAEYLSCSLKQANQSVRDLRYQFTTQEPSFKGMLDMLPNMKNTPDGMGIAMTRETYEFYEMFYRYEIELFEECLKDPSVIDKLLHKDQDEREGVENATIGNKGKT